MKFRYHKLDIEIELNAGETNFFIIENPRHYDELLSGLQRAFSSEDAVVSMVGSEPVDITKIGNLINSPVELRAFGSSVKRKLYSNLEKYLQGSVDDKFQTINSLIVELLDELSLSTDYDIEFDLDFEIKDMLSDFNVRRREPEGIFVQRLIDYIKFMNRITHIKYYFVVGCSGLLENSDLKHLNKTAKYEDISILFIDSNQGKLDSINNRIIIDYDLCTI